jgi:hypothetical protein
LEQDGLIVVTAIGLVVDEPYEVCAVGLEVKRDILGSSRLLKRDLAERDTKRNIVVLAHSELSSCHIGRRSRYRVGVCIFIVYSSKSVRGDTIIQNTALRSKLRAHPVGITRCTDGFNDDIGTLSDAEGDDVRGIWLHGNEVNSNDSQGVTVDAELLEALGTGVDEAKEMLLARLKLELGDAGIGLAGQSCIRARVLHLPIDEIVVG